MDVFLYMITCIRLTQAVVLALTQKPKTLAQCFHRSWPDSKIWWCRL